MWDPALEPLRAEIRQVADGIAAAMAAEPPIETVPAAETRAARDRGEGPFPPPVRLDHAETRTIAGVPVRVIVPESVEGVYLHMHGGGWTLGSEDGQDVRLDQIANAAGVAVVSVGYRLAPEHQYPAAADDCEAVAVWLAANAEAELGARTIVIGGDSAGATLGVGTLLRLRDKHDALGGFIGANLVYGFFDLTGTPSMRAWDRDVIISPTSLAWFTRNYVGERTGDELRDPDLSPLYADLHGMPPALLSVGTADPLLDDTLFMAARWEAAGAAAELAVYPDAPHSFSYFPAAMAQVCNDRIDAWIRERVQGVGAASTT